MTDDDTIAERYEHSSHRLMYQMLCRYLLNFPEHNRFYALVYLMTAIFHADQSEYQEHILEQEAEHGPSVTTLRALIGLEN